MLNVCWQRELGLEELYALDTLDTCCSKQCMSRVITASEDDSSRENRKEYRGSLHRHHCFAAEIWVCARAVGSEEA